MSRTPRVLLSGSGRVAALLAGLALLAACGGTAPSTSPRAATPPPATPGSSTAVATPPPAAAATLAPPTIPPTQALIEFLLARTLQDPADSDAQLELGLALLQRIRETADPSLYPAAEAALEAAGRLRPDDPLPLVGLGGLQLGKHEFAAALRTGEAALALDPGSSSARGVVIDALVELGRYDEAFDAVEDLAAASAELPSLARLSYARELQGHLPGALEAMQQAAAAPGLAPENTAFALSLVGHLQQQNGDPILARQAYAAALDLVPDHAPSIAGLGRLAIAAGDLDAARGHFERAASILPLPEYVIALGETLRASGDQSGADLQYDLARAQMTLFEAAGVVVDLEFALFETDHGDAARAVQLAQTGYAATPTVRAADALAWALHHAGRDHAAWNRAQEALRLGSLDPLVQYHAGVIAAALGDEAMARNHLELALSTDPGFSATGAQDARAILGRLAPAR
jgi:tetratricopeptide (TPR) repeat protein